MTRVFTCVNCRNSVGLDNNQNYFTVSLGSHRGRYTVCYACWVLEPLRAARAVVHTARSREKGVIDHDEFEQIERNLARVAGRDRDARRPDAG